jgi:protoheme IX farnesyltransferase
MTTVTATADTTLPADWRDFVALTKPRVMSLVVFTGLCGLLVAPAAIHPVLGFTAILCIALGAGAAAALNMWYEADLDALMKRTASRPLPAGRMERQSALHFGVGLGVFSVLLMGVATNWFAATISPSRSSSTSSSTPSGSSGARRRTSLSAAPRAPFRR